MKILVHFLTVFIIAASLSACGGTSSSPSPVASPPPPVANVSPTVALPNIDRSALRGVPFSYDATQGGRTFSDRNNDRLSYSVRFNSEETFGLSADGGILSGTPTEFGAVSVTVIATDPDGETASDDFTVFIGSQPELRNGNDNQTTRIGAPFTYDPTQAGQTFTDDDNDALTYTVSLAPAGQALSVQGTEITGTPAVSGPVTVTITATDDDGNSAQDSFEILVLPREASQLFVTQDAGIINVFVKGSTATSDKYLRYQFQRHDKPASRATGWGWRFLDEATLRNNESFEIGTRLMRGGENFVAVREVGKTDFMGGTIHGDQVDSSFKLLIDGTERPIDGATRYIGESVQFLQSSLLYEVDNPIPTETAEVQTHFEITFEVATLRNRVEFLRPIELSSVFIAMLSAERQLDTGSRAIITSEGAYSPDFEPIDISRERHEAATAFGPDEIRLSGPSGYSFSVKMVGGWDNPLRRSYISGDPAYNKVYFSPVGLFKSTGPGLKVPAGHVIEVEAEYRLDTTN